MKLILTLAAAMLISAPAYSEGEEEAATCEQVGELAELIMSLRQKETPMSQMMSAMGAEGDIHPFVRAVILDAYDRPAYLSSDAQREAALRFRNDAERICYNRM